MEIDTADETAKTKQVKFDNLYDLLYTQEG